MNLYLKYRPKTIDELDLSGVRKILSDIVKANNVAHAYLLTGPRGSGKTSTARVLARMVNCERNGEKLGEPCNKCSACQSILNSSAIDVIEIDAASNRGIDDIRELKEKIRLAPAILRKKVYIIDEVHMLTTEAFNALLKTLEEPPSHSLFILCTTELHKVPETIISRCAQIQFTKATPSEMLRSFKRVIEGERATADEGALEYLSKAVDGSFRDGVKIIDQVISHSRSVILADVEQVISGSRGYRVELIVKSLSEKNVTESLRLFNEAITNGIDMNYLLVSVMRGLRDKLLMGEVEIEVTKFIFVLDEVARRMATSLDGELLIQVAIVEWCGIDSSTAVGMTKKVETVQQSSRAESRDPVAKPVTTEVKSSWASMKEKIKSGEKIGKSDTIDEAIAIFSS
ncbi:DNA polymerase III, subunit gamma and tau [Candidatus Collierbacteria bacterium CG10_big_fil_rev_8_21_14_0_10_44_9]|uniref:DNA polymerase III subunit gamma/tau n=1 Tax=Candidatus Collierbacteria bacterium CG10_big_fil_rev_8_21_14_0_10_44_9 TaxID=1974535 RepID=A0A2H0VKV0_9BACT|nr:MAG: DNA polymerase III, subunit gamma and tau [Candidatus Collierbacteria bacterium CG10_big_fil_rev_8_21_14_0_10_44_9]